MESLATIVRKAQVKVPTATEIAHMQRLAAVTGNRSYEVLPFSKIKELREAGFIWTVNGNIVEKFKYAGLVAEHERDFSKEAYKDQLMSRMSLMANAFGGLSPIVSSGGGIFASRVVRYVGDLPDFAMDNMMKAAAIGIRYFTIHSNEPLPVEEIDLKAIDPLLIGWLNRPQIVKAHSDNHDKAFDQLWHARKEDYGVVVAAWDLDKEITL